MIIPILILSPLCVQIPPSHSLAVLYLELGIGSRILYVGLVQLDVQAAQLCRAVQGNLTRGFTTSCDQFVLKPTQPGVTSPRGVLVVCSTELAKVIHVITK